MTTPHMSYEGRPLWISARYATFECHRPCLYEVPELTLGQVSTSQKGVLMFESQIWGGTIRRMWASENDKFRDHLLRLDRESRRIRFGMAVSDEFIKDYASTARRHEMPRLWLLR